MLSYFPRIPHRFAAGLLAVGLLFVGCDATQPDETPNSLDDGTFQVTPDFDYSTMQDVAVNVTALGNDDQPLGNVPFAVYDGEALVAEGYTDAQGRIARTLSLPASRTAITIRTDFLGLPNEQSVAISSGAAEALFGGQSEVEDTEVYAVAASSGFTYISNYDKNGKPKDLVKPRDQVSANFLSDLNQALPEGSPVPTNQPGFLASGNELDVHLLERSDVWVTFVHEGAGYTNTLGYYTYDPANPPANPSEIDEHRVIFPNVSFDGSGGKLTTGDKMFLGRFEANEAIGWFIVQNGWDSRDKEVSETAQRYYSEPDFNPNGDQHSVFLDFIDHDVIVLGFDDQPRSSGDQDFNDVLFYVTANPVDGIDTTDIYKFSTTVVDTDGDGIPDTDDAEPTDNTVASYQYGPGFGLFGTIAYEDLWPGEGDYDFNDLVLGYTVRFGQNASGALTSMDAEFIVRGIGAAYRNGFALNLPLSPSDIASVSGQRLSSGLFATSGNGTESGVASSAVVPVFDDAYGLLSKPGGFSYANTQPGAPYVAPNDTVTVAVRFARPITQAETGALSMEWLDPFLVIDQQRGMEVHLPNQMPTERADQSLFGSSQDATDVGAGVTYKTKNGGMPWAIHFGETFNYPLETTSVTNAYPQFRAWAESGGTLYPDWYSNPSYRNDEDVYQP